MFDTPLRNALPRMPATITEKQTWRRLNELFSEPPKHANCRCDTVPVTWTGLEKLIRDGRASQASQRLSLNDIERLRKLIETTPPPPASFLDAYERFVWRKGCPPCDCKTCLAVYTTDVAVSPYTAAKCPHRNKPLDLRFVRDLNKPKRTEPFKTVVGLEVHEEVAPFGQADWERAMRYFGSRWSREMHGDWLDATHSTAGPSCRLGAGELKKLIGVKEEKTSPFFELMQSSGKTWYGTDQRDAIKAGIGRLAGRIEMAMADREFSENVERVMCRVLDAYQWPHGEQCNLKSQGESMPSSISASRLADEVRALGRDNTDLSAITDAIKRAEADRKQVIVDALRSLVRLEKLKNRHEGKEFVLAYQYDNEEYIVHGVDFGYGETIEGDEEDEWYRVFLNEPEGIEYEYHTMKHLRACFDNANRTYYIEYLD